MSIDYIYRYVDYYWRIAPSDKETTDRIGHYLDYIAAMNPYNAKRPLESSG